MILSFLRNKGAYLLFFFLLSSCYTPAQTKSDFGLSLMKERDYFRAISVYKELAFYSSNKDSTIYFQSQIGKAYRLSHRYDLSLETYSSLLSGSPLSKIMENNCYINIGLCFLGQQVPSQSLFYLEKANAIDTTGIASFYEGLTYCKLSEWDKAANAYQNVLAHSGSDTIKTLAKKFGNLALYGNQIAKKSPVTATVLSIIFPGAGQAYSGHYVDGLQAFAFVSAFAFASYAIYKYDKNYSSNYALTGVSVSLTALFHIANIWGAERTAEYYNLRQKELFLQEIEEKSLNLDF